MFGLILRWLRKRKRPITTFDCQIYSYSVQMSMGCQAEINISATPESLNAINAYFNKGCPVRITIEALPVGKG